METINSGESVTVTGGEAEPPVLASTPIVAPSSIDVSGGPDTVVVDFDLTDNAVGSRASRSWIFNGVTSLTGGNRVRVAGFR